jgi:hypothetical protein
MPSLENGLQVTPNAISVRREFKDENGVVIRVVEMLYSKACPHFSGLYQKDMITSYDSMDFLVNGVSVMRFSTHPDSLDAGNIVLDDTIGGAYGSPEEVREQMLTGNFFAPRVVA